MKIKYGFNNRYCPCIICLKRFRCSAGNPNKVCGLLARYLSPKSLVIPFRYIHVKKILPNLKHVRWEWNGKPGGWLNIPYSLTMSEYDKSRRLRDGVYIPQYVMSKK